MVRAFLVLLAVCVSCFGHATSVRMIKRRNKDKLNGRVGNNVEFEASDESVAIEVSQHDVDAQSKVNATAAGASDWLHQAIVGQKLPHDSDTERMKFWVRGHQVDELSYNHELENAMVEAFACLDSPGESCSDFPKVDLQHLRAAFKRAEPMRKALYIQESNSALLTDGKQITVMSACVPHSHEWDRICKIAHSNFKQYAQRHGYQLVFHTTNHARLGEHLTYDRKPTWNKVLYIQDNLNDVTGDEFIFWMDADSVFMNMETSLSELLPGPAKEMTIVGDQNCFFNAGHFMMRRSAWSLNFLRETWAMWPPPEPWDEQSVMIVLFGGEASRDVCRHRMDNPKCCGQSALALSEVAQLPTRSMNSYLSNFGHGDLVLHFAGLSAFSKATLMEKYAAKSAPSALQHTTLLKVALSRLA